jgi:uncharacterized protein (TIGR00251 family)
MATKAGRDSRTQAADEPLWCRPVAGGVVLALHVQPGARRAGLVGEHGGRLKLAVAAPPADGRANEAVLQLVADLLAVPRRAVALVSGAAARDKRVQVELAPALALARLAAHLPPR